MRDLDIIKKGRDKLINKITDCYNSKYNKKETLCKIAHFLIHYLQCDRKRNVQRSQQKLEYHYLSLLKDLSKVQVKDCK